MKKIDAKKIDNTFLRHSKVYTGTCVSEMGIFGTLLVDFTNEDREVLINEDTGLLMRTKAFGTNEGGVYGGYSFIDFPYLQ